MYLCQGRLIARRVLHVPTTSPSIESTRVSSDGEDAVPRANDRDAGETTKTTRGARAGRILFIDDEPSIRRGYRRIFGNNYDIVLAGNGDHAWDILTERRDFDVIVSDVMMPTLTGVELYWRVAKAWPTLADAFVFVTGSAGDSDVDAFLESIRNPVLAKPFVIRELVDMVERRLRR